MTGAVVYRSAVDAAAAGCRRYFTGEPCPKKHVAERYTLNGWCVECCREANAKRRKKIRQTFEDNRA